MCRKYWVMRGGHGRNGGISKLIRWSRKRSSLEGPQSQAFLDTWQGPRVLGFRPAQPCGRSSLEFAMCQVGTRHSPGINPGGTVYSSLRFGTSLLTDRDQTDGASQ